MKRQLRPSRIYRSEIAILAKKFSTSEAGVKLLDQAEGEFSYLFAFTWKRLQLNHVEKEHSTKECLSVFISLLHFMSLPMKLQRHLGKLRESFLGKTREEIHSRRLCA